MKKCPFCAEEIQDEAVKCRFCGEFLDKSAKQTADDFGKPKTKWYFLTSVVVIAILCVGPLALPLVWFNPRYKAVTKLAVTIAVIALTILLSYLTMYIYLRLMEQMETLGIR
jgi:low affinity Fe/Cu permease